MSLPESIAKGATMLGGEPIYLPVDIMQSTTEGQEPKAPSLGGHSIPIPTASLIRAPLPKAEGQVSMTTEVRDLLSQVVLDTSGHASGSSTTKRLEPVDLVTPPPPNQKISPNQWIHPPKWVPQMMPKLTTPPGRRSMPPPPLQSEPQAPMVTGLP